MRPTTAERDTNKYYGGKGNYVIVLHSNNTVAYYGHFKISTLSRSKQATKPNGARFGAPQARRGQPPATTFIFRPASSTARALNLQRRKSPPSGATDISSTIWSTPPKRDNP